MFISVEEVNAWTGYTVDNTLLAQAQMVIESYVGKEEADVDQARDVALLGRAVAFQAIYMKENPTLVFEQIAISNSSAFGSNITFRSGDKVSPFVAPMAVIACNNLSWHRSRSVKVGKMNDRPRRTNTWRTD